MERLEAKAAELESRLQKPEVLADQEQVEKLGKEYQDLQTDLAYALREWEQVAEQAL